MTYKCNNCGEIFDEPWEVRETHGFNDGFYETFYVCPYCGSDDYEEEEE